MVMWHQSPPRMFPLIICMPIEPEQRPGALPPPLMSSPQEGPRRRIDRPAEAPPSGAATRAPPAAAKRGTPPNPQFRPTRVAWLPGRLKATAVVRGRSHRSAFDDHRAAPGRPGGEREGPPRASRPWRGGGCRWASSRSRWRSGWRRGRRPARGRSRSSWPCPSAGCPCRRWSRRSAGPRRSSHAGRDERAGAEAVVEVLAEDLPRHRRRAVVADDGAGETTVGPVGTSLGRAGNERHWPPRLGRVAAAIVVWLARHATPPGRPCSSLRPGRCPPERVGRGPTGSTARRAPSWVSRRTEVPPGAQDQRDRGAVAAQGGAEHLLGGPGQLPSGAGVTPLPVPIRAERTAVPDATSASDPPARLWRLQPGSRVRGRSAATTRRGLAAARNGRARAAGTGPVDDRSSSQLCDPKAWEELPAFCSRLRRFGPKSTAGAACGRRRGRREQGRGGDDARAGWHSPLPVRCPLRPARTLRPSPGPSSAVAEIAETEGGGCDPLLPPVACVSRTGARSPRAQGSDGGGTTVGPPRRAE